MRLPTCTAEGVNLLHKRFYHLFDWEKNHVKMTGKSNRYSFPIKKFIENDTGLLLEKKKRKKRRLTLAMKACTDLIDQHTRETL